MCMHTISIMLKFYYECQFCVSLSDFKKQVLANLANFAYDPINYEYLRKLNVLDLFLDVLVEETDAKMIQFSIGGICNCCLDKLNKEFFIANDAISIIAKHLSSSNLETLQSALTTLMFLTTPQSKQGKTCTII